MKKNQSPKKPISFKPSSAPAGVIEKARAVDAAIMEDVSDGKANASSIMGEAVTVLPNEGGAKRGRPVGTTKAAKEAEAAAAAAAAIAAPDPMIVALLGQITTGLVILATKNGCALPLAPTLTSEGKLSYSHESWREQVLQAELVVYQKYCPDLLNKYGAELVLCSLILPWVVTDVIPSMLKKLKARKNATSAAAASADNSGNDRHGKNNAAGKVDGTGAAASTAA